MKRILGIVIFLCSLAPISFAQSNAIPNAGFEDWSGSPENPDKWGVINFSFLTLIEYTSATKSEDSHSGIYALQLESKTLTLPSPFPPGLIPPFPGAAVAGDSTTTINPLTLVPTKAGFAFSGHPTVLKGYYKYFPAGVDTASILVTLSHWNEATGKRDTIASGVKYLRSTVSAYTLFSVLLDTYTEMPDTAMISIFSSPASNPKDGSKLLIDDLEFYPNIYAGVKEDVENSSKLEVYPNPSLGSASLSISCSAQASFVKIYDMLGKEIYFTKNSGKPMTFATQNIKNGLYLCSEFDKNGMRISTKKFSIHN